MLGRPRRARAARAAGSGARTAARADVGGTSTGSADNLSVIICWLQAKSAAHSRRARCRLS